MPQPPPPPKKVAKVVYTVVNRPGAPSFWLRLGLAFA